MGATGRFVVALVLCAGMASAAVAGTVWLSHDNGALAVGELLRLESPPDSESVLDGHFRYSFEILRGQRPWTEADMAQRFTTQFREFFPAEELQADFSQFLEEVGPVSFVRIIENRPEFVRMLTVNENGQSFELGIVVDPDGLISSWMFDVTPSPPPMRALEASLTLVGGWLMIAGAALA